MVAYYIHLLADYAGRRVTKRRERVENIPTYTRQTQYNVSLAKIELYWFLKFRDRLPKSDAVPFFFDQRKKKRILCETKRKTRKKKLE